MCQVSIIACIYNQVSTNQSTMSCVRFNSVINYVSEHQLLHAVNAFHTTPTTYVNWGFMLLKLIGWRHYLCFKWVTYIPETTTQTPDVE